MGINTRLTSATAQTASAPSAITTDAVAVTFTANAPTPAATQTIADGDVPTVAELGQWVANQEVVCEALQADVTALRTTLAAVVTDLASIYAAINAGE
jgi:hypothetical protein